MILKSVLTLVLVGTSYYVRVPDHNHVHMALFDNHARYVGDYYQATKHDSFTAECAFHGTDGTGKVWIAPTEKAARSFVESCR